MNKMAGAQQTPQPGDDTSLAALLGHDELCIAVYRLVISQPHWTLASLASELEVSEQRLRECLDQLAELSMLAPSPGVESGTLPVHPEVGLSAHIHRRESEIFALQRGLAEARAAAADLASVYALNQARMGVSGLETLQGLEQVRVRLTELNRRATAELLAFMPGGALSVAALDASRPLDEHSLGAGVSLRTVYLDSVRNDRSTTEYAQWLSESGGEIRTSPFLPLRMLIIDRSSAVLPLDPDDSRQGAVVVHSPGVVAALVALFESVWDRATPFGQQHLPEGYSDIPSPQEAALLLLLAQGHTDEVAARKLGLSLRTVRRMMASLAGRLGAKSRFEMGVHATRAGWV
jgi:DNA-binding CsgD family transcriptional regulator